VAEPVSAVWLAVVAVGAATVALKAIGPVAFGGRELPPRLGGMLGLLAPALLAALVVTQAVGAERAVVVDARLAGVGAAAIALLLRAPLLLVIVVAAATTALLRAL
jgi:branched-subunit amino acid transport protein